MLFYLNEGSGYFSVQPLIGPNLKNSPTPELIMETNIGKLGFGQQPGYTRP